MKRYFQLFLSLSSLATKRYLENRINALSGIISSLMYFLITIFFISIIFSKTAAIQGWSRDEAFFLLGGYRTLSALFSLLALRGINFIPRYIRAGELDLLLVKPVNSQFYLTFRLTRAWELLSVVAGIILMVYALNNLGFVFSLMNITLFLVNLILGFGILYGLYFSIATLSIYFIRFSAMGDIYDIISSPLSFPVDILGKNVGFILTFIIPLGFIITVPVKIFLDKSPLFFSAYTLVFAILVFSFSLWFWNFSLKHYTSASS